MTMEEKKSTDSLFVDFHYHGYEKRSDDKCYLSIRIDRYGGQCGYGYDVPVRSQFVDTLSERYPYYSVGIDSSCLYLHGSNCDRITLY